MRNRSNQFPAASESVEQERLFMWARLQNCKYPELALLYHVPNGGSRNKAEAGRLKAEGVKAGVPDLCLPSPRGGFHGLYIELKRTKGGRISENQKYWLESLQAQGYCAVICKGWEEAAEIIKNYLNGGMQHG